MADNFSGYYAAQREENKRQREVGELLKQRRLREASGEEISDEEEQKEFSSPTKDEKIATTQLPADISSADETTVLIN
jgi:hypothetical protein